MKQLKETIEVKTYSETEAKNFIESFRQNASNEGYVVGANGYTYKCKKSKGEITDEAWVCKCVKIFNDLWGDD